MKYSANSSDVTSISLEENNCRFEFIRTRSKTKPLCANKFAPTGMLCWGNIVGPNSFGQSSFSRQGCANLSHLQSDFAHET